MVDAGVLLALAFLLCSAVVVVIFGAVRCRKQLMEAKAEVSLGVGDAALMPISGSVFLFTMYVLLRFIPKEHFNVMICFYLSAVSIFALSGFLKAYVKPNILTGCLCVAIGFGYFFTKHWIVNNILAFALGVTALESLPVSNFSTSYLLLAALFFYDIFWVFGSDVMLTVATRVDGPIKFVFPQDITDTSKRMSLLGLGDMVVPGLFVCQVLVFSRDVVKRGNFYFYAVVVAYFLSLVNTMGVMVYFKHGQPALLFIVPWLLITFSAALLWNGDVSAALNFDSTKVFEHKETDKESDSTEASLSEVLKSAVRELFGFEEKKEKATEVSAEKKTQ
ncbi:minor histocompatibility antigen H13 [Angomonas deanei]|uniref:Signal peptide peptidase, putative n=1 Tax=Angomonas deanei TaxID=59799 RepID=S9WW87_9TRYP|nr:minor histocompatibility antigen H13 [Angomonas deanei]EPY41138.1 minor histocompatibility antigen H13 [Angomonas deanei]CAD2218478.1 Signal peptide peptidase, putative [Angomonas deanei]|eukprot:EPY40280.1 minor histocompatibility antigen H13 [Angomonas deanei]